MWPTQPWRERKGQVSEASKADRKRRQKLARKERARARKQDEPDTAVAEAEGGLDAAEPQADDTASAAEASSSSRLEQAEASGSSRDTLEMMEAKKKIRELEAKLEATNLLCRGKVELDAQTRSAMQAELQEAEAKLDQLTRDSQDDARKLLSHIAYRNSVIEDLQKQKKATEANLELELQDNRQLLINIAYRNSVIKDLEQQKKATEVSLEIEKDVSRRSDRRVLAQLAEEKGRRMALELELAKRQRKK